MNNNQIMDMLTILLIVMVCILFILCVIFIVLKVKSSKPKQKKVQGSTEKKTSTVSSSSYNKQSIFKFMEFDRIDDNMIVQKGGKRYLMVIECQGINYDLMSGLEKNSVEQGFLQFLNTLRDPIQIYIQTRTVNLTGSIGAYRERVDDISKQYATKQAEYNQKVRSGRFASEELDKEKYELLRQKNLYEYGIDIVNTTERMSLNRNILSKHYYIIIPYFSEEALNGDFAKDEVSSLAFSELYTKAQSLISSLAVCGVNGKILDSTELAEFLYVAYNRDESEVFNLRRALNAGFEDLYSTAPDVLEKRMKELDIKIEEEAIKRANEVIYEVIEENENAKRVKEKEQIINQLIDEMAMALIAENEVSVGKDVAKKAKQKIKNETEEKGGEEDGKKTKGTRTKSAKSI